MIDTDTDQGFVFSPCMSCKEQHADVVYKGWILLCEKCYLDWENQDNE